MSPTQTRLVSVGTGSVASKLMATAWDRLGRVVLRLCAVLGMKEPATCAASAGLNGFQTVLPHDLAHFVTAQDMAFLLKLGDNPTAAIPPQILPKPLSHQQAHFQIGSPMGSSGLESIESAPAHAHHPAEKTDGKHGFPSSNEKVNPPYVCRLKMDT